MVDVKSVLLCLVMIHAMYEIINYLTQPKERAVYFLSPKELVNESRGRGTIREDG